MQEVWEIINENFKSDDQAHYLFTPRDLNSIINCLENYCIDLNDINQISQALFYEFTRQFGDKLVTLNEKQALYQLLKKSIGVDLTTYYYLCEETKKLKPLPKGEYQQMLTGYISEY